MASQLNPYLHFKDVAREAMTFYQTVFGGELTFSTFGEFNNMGDPSEAELIMHSSLTAPNGIVFMGSDTPSHIPYQDGSRIDMSLSGEDLEELSGYFSKLAEGGTVTVPLATSPWGDTFGMCNDKYGISWLVNVTVAKPTA